MEEDEYRATYNEVASNRCVFEKALTNNLCRCHHSRHFWLADREGYACKSAESAAECRELLEKLRDRSKFLLKLSSVGNQLPHNMEVRVQAGGMRGLRALLSESPSEDESAQVEDIRDLVATATSRYTDFDAIPYSEVVPFISRFQGRRRSRS